MGTHFKLCVDNRAVSLIYNNPLRSPPARIQRWLLRLAPYDFEIQHIPGKGNIADFLSRHPSSLLKDDILFDDDDEVNAVYDNALPPHISIDNIIAATKEDIELQSIIPMISSGLFITTPNTPKFCKFFEIYHSLNRD